MKPISYKRHRVTPDIIRHAAWLYYRSTLSLCDVGEMPAEHGIDVTCKTIRCWANKFGPTIAATSAAPQLAAAECNFRLGPVDKSLHPEA